MANRPMSSHCLPYIEHLSVLPAHSQTYTIALHRYHNSPLSVTSSIPQHTHHPRAHVALSARYRPPKPIPTITIIIINKNNARPQQPSQQAARGSASHLVTHGVVLTVRLVPSSTQRTCRLPCAAAAYPGAAYLRQSCFCATIQMPRLLQKQRNSDGKGSSGKQSPRSYVLPRRPHPSWQQLTYGVRTLCGRLFCGCADVADTIYRYCKQHGSEQAVAHLEVCV